MIRSVTGRSFIVAGVLALTACVSPTANADYISAGTLAVVVRDQSSTAVSGADVQVLDATTPFVWRTGTSSASGVVWTDPAGATQSGQTGLLGGDYRIVVTAPTGYVVASDQTNPVSAHISDKKTTTVTLKLTKTP